MKYKIRKTCEPSPPPGYRKVTDPDEIRELQEKSRVKHKDPYEAENRLRSDRNQKYPEY